MPTRVKICGITRPEDAALAAELGTDAIGLNFVGGPRKISSDQAIAILDATPTLVSTVSLLFLDDRPDETFLGALRKLNHYFHPHSTHFRIHQLYGITLQFIERQTASLGAWPFSRKPRIWLPMSVSDRSSLTSLRANVEALRFVPEALLLDTASPKLGGTGQPFNWNWIAEARDAGELENLPPIILAGGLTPDNVANAIRIAKPYAVDVSSGVEPPNQPGIKDPIKMRDFIQVAKSA